MDGYTEITYLTSGLHVAELNDDGYYEVSDGPDMVYISRAAMKEIVEFFKKEADRG
jgi:hypothetical protein